MHCICAIEIYGQAVNCIPEEIAEVFAITATIVPYFFRYRALHIAPQPCQPNWLGTLSFMLDPFYCDQDEIRTVAA